MPADEKTAERQTFDGEVWYFYPLRGASDASAFIIARGDAYLINTGLERDFVAVDDAGILHAFGSRRQRVDVETSLEAASKFALIVEDDSGEVNHGGLRAVRPVAQNIRRHLYGSRKDGAAVRDIKEARGKLRRQVFLSGGCAERGTQFGLRAFDGSGRSFCVGGWNRFDFRAFGCGLRVAEEEAARQANGQLRAINNTDFDTFELASLLLFGFRSPRQQIIV